MFTYKRLSIYFLIFLLFLGINLFKNIYVEDGVKSHLEKKGLRKIDSIECYGVIHMECHLKNLFFDKNITNTNYRIAIKEINIDNLNILDKKINRGSVVIKKIRLTDSREVFEVLNQPIDMNITLRDSNGYLEGKVNFFHKDLLIESNFTFVNDVAMQDYNFSSVVINVISQNDIIKKMIYELYKVKLLEIIESDDKEYSSTRGMNIPLGIDTPTVIPKKIFLGEPYERMVILLRSEIENFNFIMSYNQDEKITKFLGDIFQKNGSLRLKIEQKKESEK